jgi:tRNA nucleotidyltransferase (CCA-adding enzyme)
MLHFSRLIKLHSQFSLLQQIIPEQEMFVVGGALRDLLLGIGEEITDIDLTGTGTPESRWNNMHLPEIGRARFRTEKFGTMSLVQKTSTPEVTYEITPFREESGYADNRHPEQIIWSQDLLADSKRRDFTINALYRTPWTSDY